jgi:single-stranded-DNA-specific exonuclease
MADLLLHGTALQNFKLGTEIRDYLIQRRTEGLNKQEINSFQLFRKGISNLEFFYSPFLLPDILPSIDCLISAVESKKRILLYGDKDTDGVSSTAILFHFLKEEFPNILLDATTSSKNEAYGLCPEAIRKIKKFNPDLLITLDFGTSNYNEIADLKKNGIQTIVIDHHEIPSIFPDGLLINPKRVDSIYPEKRICTSFLALKLCIAILFRKSKEFNQIYEKLNDSNQLSYYQNGLEIFFNENNSQFQAPNVKIEVDRNSSIPIANSIFYLQLKKIENLITRITVLTGLAGIGTITDMMPLVGENRALVTLACSFLTELGSNASILTIPGLKNILTHTNLSEKKITSKDIGWGIGPLLNAAGRMGNTELSLALLLSKSNESAQPLIRELIKTNEERKERTKRNIYKTDKFFERHPNLLAKEILFCYEPDMEPGVSGIVATRLVENFKKPAIFITPDHGQARGSIRSFGNENVLDLLKGCEDILNQYGGHPEAGGFAIEIDRIPKLQTRIFELSNNWLKDQPIKTKQIQSDLLVLPKDLSKNLMDVLEYLEPSGHGNPAILLSISASKILNFSFMGNGKHARFKLLGGGNLKFVIWNDAEKMSRVISTKESIDLWGHLEANYFQGKSNLQFVVTQYK